MTTTLPDYLTVKELAELLRIKERKVYDLASSGEVPCSRATGKLLFPAAEVRAWIDGNRRGPGAGPAPARRAAVFLGSHDPLLSWALGQSGCGLPSYFDGSLDGLARFRAGEGLAAGLHVPGGPGEDWNVGTVQRECGDLDVALIAWATRKRGFVLRPDAAARVSGPEDLRGLRIAGRQAGSGSEVLLGTLLRDAGVAREEVSFAPPSLNETDAVMLVAQGGADVALGLEAVARPFGLGFVPLLDERFDILVDRQAYFDPPMQTLLGFCRTAAFAEHARALTGYDIGQLGSVRWNALSPR